MIYIFIKFDLTDFSSVLQHKYNFADNSNHNVSLKKKLKEEKNKKFNTVITNILHNKNNINKLNNKEDKKVLNKIASKSEEISKLNNSFANSLLSVKIIKRTETNTDNIIEDKDINKYTNSFNMIESYFESDNLNYNIDKDNNPINNIYNIEEVEIQNAYKSNKEESKVENKIKKAPNMKLSFEDIYSFKSKKLNKININKCDNVLYSNNNIEHKSKNNKKTINNNNNNRNIESNSLDIIGHNNLANKNIKVQLNDNANINTLNNEKSIESLLFNRSEIINQTNILNNKNIKISKSKKLLYNKPKKINKVNNPMIANDPLYSKSNISRSELYKELKNKSKHNHIKFNSVNINNYKKKIKIKKLKKAKKAKKVIKQLAI